MLIFKVLTILNQKMFSSRLSIAIQIRLKKVGGLLLSGEILSIYLYLISVQSCTDEIDWYMTNIMKYWRGHSTFKHIGLKDSCTLIKLILMRQKLVWTL